MKNILKYLLNNINQKTIIKFFTEIFGEMYDFWIMLNFVYKYLAKKKKHFKRYTNFKKKRLKTLVVYYYIVIGHFLIDLLIGKILYGILLIAVWIGFGIMWTLYWSLYIFFSILKYLIALTVIWLIYNNYNEIVKFIISIFEINEAKDHKIIVDFFFKDKEFRNMIIWAAAKQPSYHFLTAFKDDAKMFELCYTTNFMRRMFYVNPGIYEILKESIIYAEQPLVIHYTSCTAEYMPLHGFSYWVTNPKYDLDWYRDLIQGITGVKEPFPYNLDYICGYKHNNYYNWWLSVVYGIAIIGALEFCISFYIEHGEFMKLLLDVFYLEYFSGMTRADALEFLETTYFPENHFYTFRDGARVAQWINKNREPFNPMDYTSGM